MNLDRATISALGYGHALDMSAGIPWGMRAEDPPFGDRHFWDLRRRLGPKEFRREDTVKARARKKRWREKNREWQRAYDRRRWRERAQ